MRGQQGRKPGADDKALGKTVQQDAQPNCHRGALVRLVDGAQFRRGRKGDSCLQGLGRSPRPFAADHLALLAGSLHRIDSLRERFPDGILQFPVLFPQTVESGGGALCRRSRE